LPDDALLRLAAAPDAAAFAVFVRRHQGHVLRFARSLTRTPSDAEDVLQQSFLAAWRATRGDTDGAFAGTGSARGWLLTIAKHAAGKTHRRRARHPDEDASRASLDDVDHGEVQPQAQLGHAAGWGSDDDPERLTSALESKATLEAALARLADDDRQVLLLRDVEGLSTKEAAAVLHVQERALKSRLHRARLRLRAELRGGPA